MGIAEICQTINNYFSRIRPPFPQLNKILLVCSMIRRPGLSVIQSVANITRDLNKLGIPTGAMPDGSPNLTLAFAFASTKEIYRGIKMDMIIQGGTVPGTGVVSVTGANGGGPFTAFGTLVQSPTVLNKAD